LLFARRHFDKLWKSYRCATSTSSLLCSRPLTQLNSRLSKTPTSDCLRCGGANRFGGDDEKHYANAVELFSSWVGKRASEILSFVHMISGRTGAGTSSSIEHSKPSRSESFRDDETSKCCRERAGRKMLRLARLAKAQSAISSPTSDPNKEKRFRCQARRRLWDLKIKKEKAHRSLTQFLQTRVSFAWLHHQP
jgi:hypothetical protein